MFSRRKKREIFLRKETTSDNKWFVYYEQKFGSSSPSSRLRRPSEVANSSLNKDKGVAHSNPSKQRACGMKGSDSIVLPLAFKRVPYQEERSKSPVRILGGGGGSHDRKLELGRSVSSKKLKRDLSSDARRRCSAIKDVDNSFQTSKACASGDTGKEQPAAGRPSGSFLTGSSAARDSRGRFERSKGSDKDEDKVFNGRRKSALLVPPAASSDASNICAKGSQRKEKPYNLTTSIKVCEPSISKRGYSNVGGDAGPTFSGDSSSESSHESGDIVDNSQERYSQRRIIPGESNNDNRSCSSSGSMSPLFLNSRLSEMKLQPEQVNLPSLADDKYPLTSERKSSQSGSCSRTFLMSSSSGLPRDSGNRSRIGRDVPGLVGLINEGNTCYLNSCLQCLAHSVPLATAVQGPVDCLLQRRGSGSRAGTSERDWSSLAELLAYSFKQVVRDLWQRPAFTTTSARMFLQCVQAWAPQFAGHSQHDAQEVLRAILDGLHEALNRVTTAPPYRDLYLEPKPEEELADLTWRYHNLCQDSIIQDIFCGQLQSTIECCTCHRKSHCFDPFHDLSLPLPKNERETSIRDQFRGGNSRSRVTLHDCLSAFVAPEQLEGSNKYYCPSCKAPRTSIKKLTLYRLPPVLVLHIKRFYRSERFSYQKDDTPVYYPLQGLDFTDFLSARARRAGRPGVVYDLYGVCCHMGSLGCGHYTAQCRNCENDVWYCFNDSSVTPMQDAAVLSSSAYILFYQQRS